MELLDYDGFKVIQEKQLPRIMQSLMQPIREGSTLIALQPKPDMCVHEISRTI